MQQVPKLQSLAYEKTQYFYPLSISLHLLVQMLVINIYEHSGSVIDEKYKHK